MSRDSVSLIVKRKLQGEPTQVENGIDHHRLIEVLKFAETHRAQVSDPNFDETGNLEAVIKIFPLQTILMFHLRFHFI